MENLGHAEGMGFDVPQPCGHLAASLFLMLCLPPFLAIGACQVPSRPVLEIGRLTSWAIPRLLMFNKCTTHPSAPCETI